MKTHLYILAWKNSHGQRSLAACSPWGHKELDMMEQLSTHAHTHAHSLICGLPWWLSSKESLCQTGDVGSIPELGRSPREGNDNPIFLLGESHGLRGLTGYSQWGCRRVGYDLATEKQQQ